MEIDSKPPVTEQSRAASRPRHANTDAQVDGSESPDTKHLVTKDGEALDGNALYPTFWSLQQAFSNPPNVFSEEILEQFKKGFETTIDAFKTIPTVMQARGSDTKKGVKRKADEAPDDHSNNFNPKYLTSRDLFELEVGRLSRFKLLLSSNV